MAQLVWTPYSTIRPYLGTLPTWLNEYDAQRLESYTAYETIFHNVPESFKLVFRGSEDKPIYVPSGKLIVNTMNRYVGRNFGFKMDPEMGTPQEQMDAIAAISDLFKRERMLSKFAYNKRYGLIRGDWCWLLTADPTKPPGRRISITPLDPGMYFPINDPDNVDVVWGCDLIEQVEDGGKVRIKRTRYLRSDHPDRGGVPGGPVSMQIDVLEVEGWQGDKPKVVATETPQTILPAEITALPVYHIKNNEEPQNPFGSSELRGLERMIAAVNQSISDEDLALALEGLGLYVSDAGSPIDEDGNEVPWQLGPGKVVEIGSGKRFDRVSGVNTVGPYQEHLAYLETKMREAGTLPDVAIGRVDAQIAESGIALALQMAPVLDAAEEKDLGITDVMNQMFFDLRGWMKAYESLNMDNVSLEVAFGEKLPINREKRMAELQDLFVNGVISVEFYRDELTRNFGFSFPETMADDIAAGQAAADPYASRLGAEGEAPVPSEDEGGF